MRATLLAVTLCFPLVAAAQLDPETATEEQLRVRRCWERTTLAMLGTTTVPRAEKYYGPLPPADFTPDYVQNFFGDEKYFDVFASRFAGFVNAKWQREQSATRERNAPYQVAHWVLGKRLPWRDTFVGRFDLDPFEGRFTVVPADSGLGYFRVKKWLETNAGNEAQGYKLNTAYRMLQNTLGTKLTAAPNNTSVPDSSATGRAGPGCTSCHFEGPYPLDRVARTLTRRNGMGTMMTFTAPTDGPQQLWGHTVSDDEELVRVLISSEEFTFNTCRLVFEFMFGRPESTCEAPLFDACVQAFEAEGTIQGAVMGLARHPDYCR
jgi:hypothetical protein